jgi:hypothetical protein
MAQMVAVEVIHGLPQMLAVVVVELLQQLLPQLEEMQVFLAMAMLARFSG